MVGKSQVPGNIEREGIEGAFGDPTGGLDRSVPRSPGTSTHLVPRLGFRLLATARPQTSLNRR